MLLPRWLNNKSACLLHSKTVSQVAPTGPAFSQCTACSPPVLEALDRQGWELIKKVGEKPSHLEDLTGLTVLMQVCKTTFKLPLGVKLEASQL